MTSSKDSKCTAQKHTMYKTPFCVKCGEELHLNELPEFRPRAYTDPITGKCKRDHLEMATHPDFSGYNFCPDCGSSIPKLN